MTEELEHEMENQLIGFECMIGVFNDGRLFTLCCQSPDISESERTLDHNTLKEQRRDEIKDLKEQED